MKWKNKGKDNKKNRGVTELNYSLYRKFSEGKILYIIYFGNRKTIQYLEAFLLVVRLKRNGQPRSNMKVCWIEQR